MNENEFTIKAKVIATEYFDCTKCVFNYTKCNELQKAGIIPYCSAKHRKDGMDVEFDIESFIIVKEETK